MAPSWMQHFVVLVVPVLAQGPLLEAAGLGASGAHNSTNLHALSHHLVATHFFVGAGPLHGVSVVDGWPGPGGAGHCAPATEPGGSASQAAVLHGARGERLGKGLWMRAPD